MVLTSVIMLCVVCRRALDRADVAAHDQAAVPRDAGPEDLTARHPGPFPAAAGSLPDAG